MEGHSFLAFVFVRVRSCRLRPMPQGESKHTMSDGIVNLVL
jgi:hypothetical protein